MCKFWLKKTYCIDKMTRFQYFFFGFDDSKLVNFVELIQLKNSKIKFTFSLRVHSVRK